MRYFLPELISEQDKIKIAALLKSHPYCTVFSKRCEKCGLWYRADYGHECEVENSAEDEK